MSVWDFICSHEQCGCIVRNVSTNDCDVESVRPQHCGDPMDLYWDGAKTIGMAFEPFETTNIDPDGRKVRISGRKELSQYMNQRGLTHIDDPSLEMQGGRLVKKSPSVGKVFFT
jgi:hypothetical protein